MNVQHLFNHSRSYAWLRKYAAFCHSLFYEEVCVINRENVPDNEPVIFAPNHQNALMDALAIICTLNKQPVFMARADIFKKKSVSAFLFFLKIIPVYRIRDGVDNLSNNDQSFQLALQVLQHKKCVGIMPEGNHGDQRRLRPLKKGLARFALQVQEKFGASASLKIIPVGIEYSHYSKFRGKLLVIYGDPIEVPGFMGEYALNPQKSMNLLRDHLAEEMKTRMINIDNDEYYELICRLGELYLDKLKKKLEAGNSFYDDFQVCKIITDKLVTISWNNKASLDLLKSLVDEFYASLGNLKLSREVFETDIPSRKTLRFDIFRYAVFFPVAVFSSLFHLLPALLVKYQSDRIKDPQFQSSFKFVLGLVIFPIYYLIMLLLPIPMYSKVLMLVVMLILGILSFDYFTSLEGFIQKIRYYRLVKNNNLELLKLKKLREQILSILDSLI